MVPRTFAACAAVSLLVIAGCVAAPTADAGAASTTARPTDGTDDPPAGVTVRGGDLPVDATLVFERVRALTGSDVAPPTVRVRRLTEAGRFEAGGDAFRRTFGLARTDLNLSEPGGVTRASGRVFLYPGRGPAARVETVLAHEFVHVVQFRGGMIPWFDDRVPTTDRALARASAVEGGAVYVTDAYVAAHLPNATPQSERVDADYRAGPPGNRLFYAPYHFGHRYVAARIDAPDDLRTVYESPPESTERIIHPNRSDEPRPLAATANASGSPWRPVLRDTMGEMVLRTALRGELNRSAAARAAAGWGDDELLAFRRGDRRGFAWVLRWDDADEAEEFRRALVGYLDARRAATDAGFRVERLGAETVVVLAGDPGFVDGATVGGEEANATVTAP